MSTNAIAAGFLAVTLSLGWYLGGTTKPAIENPTSQDREALFAKPPIPRLDPAPTPLPPVPANATFRNFDPTRPVLIRIPHGYHLPAGFAWMEPAYPVPNGLWHHGDRYHIQLTVSQPAGNVQLTFNYTPGVANFPWIDPVTGLDTGLPSWFCDQHGTGVDGSFWPNIKPNRFHEAEEPLVVFQLPPGEFIKY